jgi:periplasmic divalent cation tolerance protein
LPALNTIKSRRTIGLRRSSIAQNPHGETARMERIVFVYTTYPSVVEAEEAGRALVEAGLAACVNILPGMISYYRWEGALERGEEAVMLIKTRASLAEDVRLAVREKHSNKTPAIVVLPVESVDQSYLGWLLAQTAREPKS